MAGLLEGKCAVITGAGRGQGREIALAMAEKGAKVVVNDLGGDVYGDSPDNAPADEVAAEITNRGGTAVANYNDVADFDAAADIINTCLKNFGRIDILVNCAGVAGKRATHFWETEKEAWDRAIGVNLNGTFNTCRHAVASMVKQGSGRIINFSSPAWLGMGATAYTASKGAVVSLSKGIAQQMVLEGYENITCNVLVPIAETRMSPRWGGPLWKRQYDLELITRQIYEESSDPPDPEHVVAAVIYLATEEAANINGQVIGASRGRVALYSWPTEINGLYKDGVWTVEELMKLFPSTLSRNIQKRRG